jgi:predicted translin family RNA/ssDNA-binding protein
MATFASGVSILRVDRVPATPEPFSASAVAAPDVFEACNSLLSASEASRTEVQARSRAGMALCRQALGRLHRGDLESAEAKLNESLSLAAPAASRIGEGSLATQLEQARLTGAWAEAFVGAACFGNWLRTGVLSAPMPQSLASGIGELDDEKWLGGFISAVRTLERYAVLRAERLDVASVSCALDASQAAEAALMEFEFRNSDLRRCV